MNPIDVLLDLVDWKEIPNPAEGSNDLPYATHEGILEIGGFQMKVFQLNDGQRIIDKDDFEKFFAS